jgi:hypothetical protein
LDEDIFEEVKLTRLQKEDVGHLLASLKQLLLPLVSYHFEVVRKPLNRTLRPFLEDRMKEEDIHLFL